MRCFRPPCGEGGPQGRVGAGPHHLGAVAPGPRISESGCYPDAVEREARPSSHRAARPHPALRATLPMKGRERCDAFPPPLWGGWSAGPGGAGPHHLGAVAPGPRISESGCYPDSVEREARPSSHRAARPLPGPAGHPPHEGEGKVRCFPSPLVGRVVRRAGWGRAAPSRRSRSRPTDQRERVLPGRGGARSATVEPSCGPTPPGPAGHPPHEGEGKVRCFPSPLWGGWSAGPGGAGPHHLGAVAPGPRISKSGCYPDSVEREARPSSHRAARPLPGPAGHPPHEGEGKVRCFPSPLVGRVVRRAGWGRAAPSRRSRSRPTDQRERVLPGRGGARSATVEPSCGPTPPGPAGHPPHEGEGKVRCFPSPLVGRVARRAGWGPGPTISAQSLPAHGSARAGARRRVQRG